MTDVRLVDLEVIKRYSLAIRQEAAPASELLAALDASRATVLAAMTARRPTPRATTSLPVKKAAAKKIVAKKAVVKKLAVKKTAAKKLVPPKKASTRR